jgi:multiple sugar transport system substrate-binding protein
MSKVILNGITWGHSRGYTPLVAFAQRFSEMFPDVEVIWKKRTLQEFADYPIEELTKSYDLLIIDHPWVGCASETHCVLPLEEYLSKEYLDEQLQNSVGESHLSYNYNGHQWALAIDAATPAASYRQDLFHLNNQEVPGTWDEVLELARKQKIAVPAIPIDLLMNFYSFCMAHGKEPFADSEEIIDKEIGLHALDTMREFYSLVSKEMFKCNPIAVAEQMTSTDNYWYCPFAYCYSNYSREGYALRTLTYSDVVQFNGRKLRTTIGGTGIAISAFSQNKEWAVRFAREIVSAHCQSTFYVQHGGQPGHKTAWLKEQSNDLCNNFFRNVLPAMESGYMRPRYNGYLHFQDLAGEPLQRYLLDGGNPLMVLQKMDSLYRESLMKTREVLI